MTKDLYQVVDDLFSRLPLYAADYTRVVEVNKSMIKGVVDDLVVIEGCRNCKLNDLKATREEAEKEAEANIIEARKVKLEEINDLLEELKELLK